MSVRSGAFAIVSLVGLAAGAIGSYQDDSILVEPAELGRRPELIGREWLLMTTPSTSRAPALILMNSCSSGRT